MNFKVQLLYLNEEQNIKHIFNKKSKDAKDLNYINYTSSNYTNVAGVDADVNSSSIGSLTLNTLNVQHPFLTIYANHFPRLLALIMATSYLENDKMYRIMRIVTLPK